MAGQLAIDRGWAINIGGGFHHCRKDRGGGFCPYADITLMIESLFKSRPNEVKKIMIVDLDAHQVLFTYLIYYCSLLFGYTSFLSIEDCFCFNRKLISCK